MNVYKRTYNFIRPYLLSLLFGFFSLIMVGISTVLVPLIIRMLLQNILGMGNLIYLNYLAGGAVLLYVLRGIFNYAQIYLLTGLGEKVVVDLRNNIYKHLQNQSLGFFSRRSTGDLMSTITNDVNIIQNAITMGISNLILQPLVLVGTIAFLLYIDWQLALVSFVVLPLVAYAVSVFGRKMRIVSKKIQKRLGLVTSILQETLSGIRIVKAFNMEKEEMSRFNKANDHTLKANLKGAQLKAILLPVVELIVSIGVEVFLWYGGRKVIAGELGVPELTEFLLRLGMLWAPINILSENYHLLQKAMGAGERIFALLDQDEIIEEKDNAFDIPEIEGKVEFRNVYFSYKDGEEVLQEINLNVRAGEMVALVGHSGAGKTTLVNLVPRFYDVDQGQILIDGFNIRDVTLKSLRQQIGIVPQDVILFKGTVAGNIAYGAGDKSREDIIEASRQANAHEFISKFKDGYEAEVGERGVSLSGGQKQRISIARAILTDPRILILDEATSSLDSKSEKLVQEALERLMKKRTTFVIAHRLSTILKADKIIVLEKGGIVEKGNHQELLDRKEYYYRLYQAQLKNAEQLQDISV